MKNTKIEWCDHTINFWWGCTKVSPACQHCYAESIARRFKKDIWGKEKPRESHLKNARKEALRLNRDAGAVELAVKAILADPKASLINRQYAQEWHRPRVFANSMSDWLDDEVPIQWLVEMLDTIRLTPHLDWLLLTKRPENWRHRLQLAMQTSSDGCDNFICDWLLGEKPTNIWIGTTIEDQKRADERIPHLLKIPTKVRFLSCEPLLEEINLYRPFLPIPVSCNLASDIHWIIAGGESGSHARPMHQNWIRTLRDDCLAANIPFFFKQWGEWTHPNQGYFYPPATKKIHDWSDGTASFRYGKTANGRQLDGVEWSQFPRLD